MIGIYKIVNTFNSKVYIGQTNDIERRKNQHFAALENNKHENKEMQREYNKYKEFFKFYVVEECSLSMLNIKEKEWIAKYDSFKNGYNANGGGGSRKRKNSHNRPTCLLDELTE